MGAIARRPPVILRQGAQGIERCQSQVEQIQRLRFGGTIALNTGGGVAMIGGYAVAAVVMIAVAGTCSAVLVWLVATLPFRH